MPPAAIINISLSIAPWFSKHAPPVVVYSLLIEHRLVSRLVLSRLVGASRSYIGLSINVVFVIPSRRALLTGSYSPPVSSPGVKHDIAIVPIRIIPYISIVFSYSCILVSFIYIAYIIFIIYIHRRDMMSRTPIPKQAAASSPSVSPSQIG